MDHNKRYGIRFLALLLGMVMLLAPLSALAMERELKHLGVTGDKKSYNEKLSAAPPADNLPESGVNPLTGEPWTGVYRPVAVTTDTDPKARDNYGVSDADIIYELPLHRQGNTRSVALYMSAYPTLGAGPVRSARIPMVDIAAEWGAAYMFFGMQEAKGTSVSDHVKEAYNSPGTNSYPYMNLMNRAFMANVERTNYSHPHNVRVNVVGVMSEVNEPTPQMRPWKFSEEGLDRGASAYTIHMEHRPDTIPSYIYNELTRSYDRYYNGAPFVDGNNGRHCTFANVIVMRTDVSWFRNNPQRPVVKLTGEGVAEIFMNGRYIRGSWVRASLGSRTVFLDENGQEISFLPGKTFIHIVHVDTKVIVGSDPSVGDVPAN